VIVQGCFFHRLFSIPLSEPNFNKELSWIRTLATNNGFPVSLVKIYYNHFKKFVNRNLLVKERDTETRYFSIPYLGPFSLGLVLCFPSPCQLQRSNSAP